MTWVHFLAPASSGSQPPETLPSRDPKPFSGVFGQLDICGAHKYTLDFWEERDRDRDSSLF